MRSSYDFESNRNTRKLIVGAEMEKCIFCNIVQDKLSSYAVAESNYCLAILDNQPLHQGHVLIVTKQHFDSILDLPLDVFQDATVLAYRISKAIDDEFHPPRVGVLIAGFDIAHFHLHVVGLQHRSDISTRRVVEDSFVAESVEVLQNVQQRLVSAIAKQS